MTSKFSMPSSIPSYAYAKSHRIGFGEDAHRLSEGHPLVLGGVQIPHAQRGAVAHSDGDVILHALADALLSGLALGDIGQYFPDTDVAHKDLDSTLILAHVLKLIREHHYWPLNIAVVVILDQPKLGDLRTQIAEQLAYLLKLKRSEVGISFKTSEGLAPDHIQARVTVLLGRYQQLETNA